MRAHRTDALMSTSQTRSIVMTTTDELFLPSRIIYRVYDRTKLERKLRSLRSMFQEPTGRWTWNYEFEARELGFPAAYDKIPPERQPLLLASCYWAEADAFYVYVRSTLRLTKFLVFFDKQVPRAWAKGEVFDEYNLVTTRAPGEPLPRPEDCFGNESNAALRHLEAESAGSGWSEDELQRMTERTLKPLDRHRLDAFYEDGEEHMDGAMRLREILAMKQHCSKEPIRPYDVMLELIQKADRSGLLAPDLAEPKPSEPRRSLRKAVEPWALDDYEPVTFSCLRMDRALDRWVLEMESSPGQPEAYWVSFGGCDNPACDCRALEAWIEPVKRSGAAGGASHVQLRFDTHQAICVDPADPRGRALAQELAKRFTAEDWFISERIYKAEKTDVSEPADASNLGVSLPERVLADSTLLMEYQEVFPYARRDHFKLAGKYFVVFEHYCSNPACPCTEVNLDIAACPPPVRGLNRPSPPHEVSSEDATSIMFDYRTAQMKIAREGPPDSPSAHELLQALRTANPELNEQLQRRNQLLRQLHRQARPNRPAASLAQPIRTQEKVGRNEPCPCGSGRKFKQCCGR
jgi:SEC-C motif